MLDNLLYAFKFIFRCGFDPDNVNICLLKYVSLLLFKSRSDWFTIFRALSTIVVLVPRVLSQGSASS